MRAHVEGLEIVSAGLAHEIHNPLNFIKNANLLIAENVGKLQETLAGLTGVPPERTGAIDKIRGRIDKMVQSSTRGVERIEKVVDLIRRYAREGYPTEASEVDFDLAVAEVTELVAPRADMEGRVTEQLGAPGRVVRAIPEELNQVIRSLVQNACESVGPTGKVHVSTRVDGAHVVLEVTDNGPGISPENVAKIFSPFFTTKPGSGRGMGLAIVQIVINRIGGTVEVTSTPGRADHLPGEAAGHRGRGAAASPGGACGFSCRSAELIQTDHPLVGSRGPGVYRLRKQWTSRAR